MTIADIVGIIGDILVILAFFLIQTGRINSSDLSYPLLNIIGALGILFSLTHHWNLPAFIIEFAWIIISIWGIYSYFKNKSKQ